MNAPITPATTTVGQYLIGRLLELGARHVFGIPGDYVLNFFHMLENSDLDIVVTTNELCAGYAADAYARVNGLGVACVTYAVGGFSLTNALASAHAEKSPVVLISGAPGVREHRRNWHLHHMVGHKATQLNVFEPLTVAQAVIDDPLTAFREIDRVLAACLRYQRPVYIELPRDKLGMTPIYPHTVTDETPVSDPNELGEAVSETAQMLRKLPPPGHHRRGRAAPPQAGRPGAGLRREVRHPPLLHPPEQVGHPRTTPVVPGGLPGGDGPLGGDALRRGVRLRPAAGGDDHRHGHGHFQPPPRRQRRRPGHQRARQHPLPPLRRRAPGRLRGPPRLRVAPELRPHPAGPAQPHRRAVARRAGGGHHRPPAVAEGQLGPRRELGGDRRPRRRAVRGGRPERPRLGGVFGLRLLRHPRLGRPRRPSACRPRFPTAGPSSWWATARSK